jgi:hypothetical protein
VIGPAKRKMRHTLHGEQSAEILYVTEPHQSLFRTAVLFDDYGMLYIVFPSSGWFTQIIWDAAPHMLITVDSFSY